MYTLVNESTFYKRDLESYIDDYRDGEQPKSGCCRLVVVREEDKHNVNSRLLAKANAVVVKKRINTVLL